MYAQFSIHAVINTKQQQIAEVKVTQFRDPCKMYQNMYTQSTAFAPVYVDIHYLQYCTVRE